MNVRKIFIYSFIATILSLVACQKDSNLGEDIVTMSDSKINMVFTDTVTIDAYSVLVDSVSTSKLKYNLLGSIYDNVFGTTTASIYTQLRLSENNVDFGTNAVCDSIILTLDYVGFYGDTPSVQTLRVFELDEDLNFDSTYFSNDNLSYNPIEIGSLTAAFKPNDSVDYFGVKVKPHLVLKLNKSFGEKIMAKSGQSELSDNENFKDFIKGIYITSDKAISDGGLAYFDLMSSLSLVTLYYHNDEDTLNYKFAINEFCSYFSSFNHYDYADANAGFKAQVIQGDKTLGNQMLYVQSLGGVKTKLYFPHLKELTKNGPIAVQNAELLINVQSGSDIYNEPIYGLAVTKLDSLGKPQFINDYYEGSTYFGGDYNEDNKYYFFNLNRYVQSILSENENPYGLEIVAKGASIYGNRLIFAGPKTVSRPLRLKVTYTRVY